MSEAPLVSDDLFSQHPLKWLKTGTGLWVYDKEVANLMNDSVKHGHLPSIKNCSAGAVKWAWAAVAILWCFFLAFPFFAFHYTECPDEKHAWLAAKHHRAYYVRSPVWLWYVYFPFLVVSLILEAKCFTYIFPAEFYVVKKVTIMGINLANHPFPIFRMLMIGLSAVGHTSIASNSLFVARMWKEGSCTRNEFATNQIERLWNHVISQSMLASLPEYLQPSFTQLVTIAWMLMWMQLLQAMGLAIPIGPPHTSGDRIWSALSGTEGEKFKVSYKVPASYEDEDKNVCEYATLLDPRQNHGAALRTLADSARMMSVRYISNSYIVEKMKLRITAKSPGWEFKYLRLAKTQIQISISSFLLMGVLETTIQLNLQISLLAITRNALCTDYYDINTIASVCLNFGSHLLKMFSIIPVSKTFIKVRKNIVKGVVPLDGVAEREWRMVWFSVLRLALYACAYVFLLGYALVKAVALFACDSGLWNVTGCVEYTNDHCLTQ